MDANDLGEVWAAEDGQELLRVGGFDGVDVLFSFLLAFGGTEEPLI
jgi:hypothetical protein